MGHYSTAEELYRAGADPHPPNGLFRNIWDSNELRQSVNNCEAGLKSLVEHFNRNLERVWDFPSIADEAAVQFKHMGQTNNAEEMYRRALEGWTIKMGAEHPHTLASTMNLASILRDQMRYEEAEEMYRLAWEGYEKVLGPVHPDTLDSTINLGSILRDQRRYEEAEEMYRLTWERYEKALGPLDPDTVAIFGILVSILQNQGKYEEAKEMNRQVLVARFRACRDIDLE